MYFVKDLEHINRSHPVWVRGLKHTQERVINAMSKSHPVWVRGLKLTEEEVRAIIEVAPRVGAWIET